MQPGDTITPGQQPTEKPPEPEAVQSQDTSAAPLAEQPAPPPPAEAPSEPEQAAPEPSSQWQFSPEEPPAETPAPASHEAVHWTASEYVAHEKGANWYLLLGLAVLAFAAAVYFMTDELVSPVVIVIMGAAFGAFAARKPQELNYALDNTALHVGERSYPYGQFKSFTIVEEGPIHSITLMPLQRFMPPLSVYYAPEDEEKIANALQSYLPYEDRKQDFIDKFMRKVRF